MKKLFTLLGVVLMASSAFGQKFRNIIVNGDCEGTAPAYERYQDCTDVNAWNSFWVHEWRGDMSSRFDGTAEIVEGEGVDNSKCVKVVIRSFEQAKDKNPTLASGSDVTVSNLASWDSQFFIYATEPMPEGSQVQLTMYVRADKACSIETQAHFQPGEYNHYQLFGNVNVTTEWEEVTFNTTVSSSHVNNRGFQSVAFNLTTGDKDGNVIYFDNIKLEAKITKPVDFNEPAEWINFMRRGVFSEDHITGVDGNGNPWECSNFTVQDLNKPAGEQQQKAPVVEVEPGVMAVKVPVKSYYIKQVEDLDEAGEQQFDPETGEIKMKNIYYWNDGVEIGTSAPARWQCQFFVSTLHKMKSGERYKFRFQAKADKPTALGTQAHYGPGQYKDYNTFGSESDFPIGTEWTLFDLGDAQEKTVPSGADGCQTITFDCVPLEGEEGNCEPNNFYFIFEECSFTEENVTDADRTLGTAEYLVIPLVDNIEEQCQEAVYKLDITPMLNTYIAEDFSFIKEPNDGIKLLAKKEDPERDGVMMDSYSSMLTLGEGGFIGTDGYFLGLNNDQGIQLNFDTESLEGNNIDLSVWNNSGESISNGKVVNTKLVISQSGWYYLYNITLMSKEDYDVYLNGVKAVEEKIEAIDEVVTLESKAGIDDARTAYNALPEYGQKNVSNYAKLAAAEAEYKRLADIKDCIDKIDAIGTVVLTDECKALIDAARSAYDALSEASQAEVTNYQTLLDAEQRYKDLEATGISTVTSAAAKSGIMYDLMGRQVTKASKGLYILNGKKYFQK